MVDLRLGEQVANARGSDADEHLDEVGAAQTEEGYVGFAGDGLREKRLACAGSADQQDTLGDLSAEPLVAIRML